MLCALFVRVIITHIYTTMATEEKTTLHKVIKVLITLGMIGGNAFLLEKLLTLIF